ncbi:hypothetical protein BT93_L2563 [Corymbia citriodora subsp. variegata]|uniref:Uncharacterized protein n=1 Tax=Corymbia citriodora subsp. variegata TaxID=360336 RepID=A0A8T0CNZ5_CORYI|nr:hypothetical protein BT93_L2563 [Corymbia citriodora subsp. variegata]
MAIGGVAVGGQVLGLARLAAVPESAVQSFGSISMFDSQMTARNSAHSSKFVWSGGDGDLDLNLALRFSRAESKQNIAARKAAYEKSIERDQRRGQSRPRREKQRVMELQIGILMEAAKLNRGRAKKVGNAQSGERKPDTSPDSVRNTVNRSSRSSREWKPRESPLALPRQHSPEQVPDHARRP